MCAREIVIETCDGKVTGLDVKGGCPGYSRAMCSLVRGMDLGLVAKRLRGIDCGGRGTSCADKIATAIDQIIAKESDGGIIQVV